ncbi:response regulator transcription factor [Coralliovum pocilloporae]|uniref:response regulator transcription factor n=1 Tax=Coralliovum pocilloporae TaxID=3066369 RepID=UPI003306E07D
MTDQSRPCVVIVDKNPLVLSGLQAFIERDGRFDVVAALPTGQAFLDQVADLTFDVGVIGWSLSDMTGGDILVKCKAQSVSARLMIYSGESSPDILRQAIKLGAFGFCSKGEDPADVLDAISSVARGRMSFPYVDMGSVADDPLTRLTERERELLAALADGWTNVQIASRIGISQNTVKYHLKNLYDKLDVKNRAMAVALFVASDKRSR